MRCGREEKIELKYLERERENRERERIKRKKWKKEKKREREWLKPLQAAIDRAGTRQRSEWKRQMGGHLTCSLPTEICVVFQNSTPNLSRVFC